MYSVVGQVAVTGKQRWICADDQATSSGLSFEVRILVIKYCPFSLSLKKFDGIHFLGIGQVHVTI